LKEIAMLGTIVNVIAIIAGGAVGILLKGGIPPKFSDTVMKGLALSVLLVGVMNALKVNNLLLVIIAMVLGGIVGHFGPALPRRHHFCRRVATLVVRNGQS
jgi:hypothetical protein